MQEISPLLPPECIREFQQKFKNETEISKPEEANGLEKIEVWKDETLNPLYSHKTRERDASQVSLAVGSPLPLAVA
jgi:hypothetical protein